MTELILVRHGETDWNAERRLQGHLDIPLNATGLSQAQALGQALRHEQLDALFVSDLQRAMQTAAPIGAAHGLPLQIDAGLRERCYGAFEGLLYDEIDGRYPLEYAAWKAGDLHVRYPAGEFIAETLHEFDLRSTSTVLRIVTAATEASAAGARRIAIVTHGGVLECIYRAAKKLSWTSPRDFDIRNASINRLTLHLDGWSISQWGEVAHLQAQVLDEHH